MPQAKRVATISNKKGLHARAAAKFVKKASEFRAIISVTRLGTPPEGLQDEDMEWTVSATSILGLMMLAAEPGTELELQADGEDAEAAVQALQNLIDAKFDEGE
ncbi:MAG: HPr family phosphocarrier protein [Rickettsiales bacterium]|nr:HPr family phosphocarrier protein [Rickettsiales bacterium]|tara:strand:- start:448 stop:759 length:312 start_codon:yes stop_codon:yes gene_type:complete